MAGGLRHFLDTFGVPRPPRPRIIPARWRVPFYIGLSVVSLLALLILIFYVVIPGIRASQPSATSNSGAISAPSE